MKNRTAALVAVLAFLVSIFTLGCVRRDGPEEWSTPSYPAATAGDDPAGSTPSAPQDDADVTAYTQDVVRCTQVMRSQGRQQATQRMLTGEAAEAFVDQFVFEQCGKSRPAPGVQLPVSAPAAAEESVAESADNEPPPPSAPPADEVDEDPKGKHLRSLTGIIGDMKPSGCTGASCLYFAKVPYLWGKPMCSGISARVDDFDVKWISAGRVVLARVNPGEGFESLGGNRVSILRKGEHGFVHLTAPTDATGNGHPAKLAVGDHALELTCWDLTQRTSMIGGRPRLVQYATKIGVFRGRISNGRGQDPTPETLPMADAWR